MPMKRLFMLTEVTRAESKALWNTLDLDVDMERHLKNQLNLHCFFKVELKF